MDYINEGWKKVEIVDDNIKRAFQGLLDRKAKMTTAERNNMIDKIQTFLKIAFWIVLIVGLYQIMFTMFFYTPPTKFIMSERWFEGCIGIFIVASGLGIMFHGIALVKVSR